MSKPYINPEMTAEERRFYEQEALIGMATERLSEMMHEKDLSKADLARLLGTSRAYVTNLLSGRTNLTLRTLADVAVAMGYRVEIKHEPLRTGEFITSPLLRGTHTTKVHRIEGVLSAPAPVRKLELAA